jgi:RNA-directed DNA polymerase
MTEKVQEYFEFYESIEILETYLPQKLATLRQKLSKKAKKDKRFRFYSLFDHVCAHETLLAAWKQVKVNDGSPGIDEASIKDIEQQEGGIESYLSDIKQSLRDKSYIPDPVCRVYIPKANGKLRPLGIPTVRDRIVQTAVLLILEPIFEADFEECSYGFRPGRSAHDALKAIGEYLKQGFCGVYDADLKGYFDSIPHDKLIACLRMRVVDGSVLKLIRLWLKAPVVDSPENEGNPTVKRNTKGTPQGGVISPLLANIYLHWFDKVFHFSNGPANYPKC